MTSTSPLLRLTLEEWDADNSFPDQHVELVQGVPEVNPPEALDNRRIVTRVILLLSQLPSGWTPITETDITVDPHAPTVRRPDVTVVSDLASGAEGRHEPSVAALVVEVVSPTSRVRDWVAKQAEYAAAGIGAYLVVDPGKQALALFTDPGPSGYATRAGETESAVWSFEGIDIVFRLDDLLGR